MLPANHVPVETNSFLNLPDDPLRLIYSYVIGENILEIPCVSKKIFSLYEDLYKSEYQSLLQVLESHPSSARALKKIQLSEISLKSKILHLFRNQFSQMQHFKGYKPEFIFYRPKGSEKNILKQFRDNEEQLERPLGWSLNSLIRRVCKENYPLGDLRSCRNSDRREICENYFEENLETFRNVKVLDYAACGPALWVLTFGLSPCISELINLEKLNLSGHKVSQYPNQLLALNSIKKINLAECSLFEFPVQILKLNNLESLRLSNNKIFDIPLVKITKNDPFVDRSDRPTLTIIQIDPFDDLI